MKYAAWLLRGFVVLSFLATAPSGARADWLVEFVSGHVLRIEEYQVQGDYLRLVLGDKSEMTVLRSKVAWVEEAEISRDDYTRTRSDSGTTQSRSTTTRTSGGSMPTGGGSQNSGQREYSPPDGGSQEAPPQESPESTSDAGERAGDGSQGRNVWDAGSEKGGSTRSSSRGGSSRSGPGSSGRR